MSWTDYGKAVFGKLNTKCKRCNDGIMVEDAEVCWYCGGDLCADCWDEYGHCGHEMADEQNESARKHYEAQK